jgi:hypothetical protein
MSSAAAKSDDTLFAYLCRNCGMQYPPTSTPPASCCICEDERQYVSPQGQQWATLADIQRGHRNRIVETEPGLHSIHPVPDFGIGQRAFLVRTPEGNLLWDCVALLDAATISAVNALGGIRAIAISHPHYYTAMIEWSEAFGSAPVYLHEADREWVMRDNGQTQFWSGGERLGLFGGLELHRTGGHFDGFQVALWPAGAEGRGVLLAGDQPQVCADRRWVSFMYSYPNYIPLGPRAVRNIAWQLSGLPFDRLYGPFPGREIASGAREAIARSATRYLQAIGR